MRTMNPNLAAMLRDAEPALAPAVAELIAALVSRVERLAAERGSGTLTQRTAQLELGMRPATFLRHARRFAADGGRVERAGKLRVVERESFLRWLAEEASGEACKDGAANEPDEDSLDTLVAAAKMAATRRRRTPR